MLAKIQINQEEISAFCQRWQVNQFALFGSVLREDFHSDSDIDVLVEFEPGTKRRFKDLWAMENELQALFGRPVDLGTRQSVEQDPNYLRRRAILGSLQVTYEK